MANKTYYLKARQKDGVTRKCKLKVNGKKYTLVKKDTSTNGNK